MILTIHRHVISRIPRFSISHDNAKTWLLHITSVQQEDRGYYMCQVNTNPMISQVGYLQVVGKPFIYKIILFAALSVLNVLKTINNIFMDNFIWSVNCNPGRSYLNEALVR